MQSVRSRDSEWGCASAGVGRALGKEGIGERARGQMLARTFTSLPWMSLDRWPGVWDAANWQSETQHQVSPAKYLLTPFPSWSYPQDTFFCLQLTLSEPTQSFREAP